MKPAEFHESAQEELFEAGNYYAHIRPELGTDFEDEINAALRRIQTSPLLFSIEVDPFRKCLVDRFPYSIVYIDLPDRIYIAAIAHHSRRPDYWLRRLPPRSRL